MKQKHAKQNRGKKEHFRSFLLQKVRSVIGQQSHRRAVNNFALLFRKVSSRASGPWTNDGLLLKYILWLLCTSRKNATFSWQWMSEPTLRFPKFLLIGNKMYCSVCWNWKCSLKFKQGNSRKQSPYSKVQGGWKSESDATLVGPGQAGKKLL